MANKPHKTTDSKAAKSPTQPQKTDMLCAGGTIPQDAPCSDAAAGQSPPPHEQELIRRTEDLEKQVQARTLELQTAINRLDGEIAEGQRLREAMRLEHEFSERMLDTVRAIVLILDTQGRIVRFNRQFEEISGYCLDEVRGRDWFETFLPQRDHQNILAVFAQATEGKRTTGNMNPIVTKDGEERIIEWFDAPLTDAKGDLIGLLCTGNDVTERLRSTEALRESRDRIQAIMTSAAEAIVTIGEDGPIESFNPAAERMFGYTADEVVGRNVSLLMPSPYREEHNHYLTRYLRTGRARIIGIGREVLGRRKDGTTFPMHLSVSEILDGVQRIFTGIIHDLTTRKKLEAEILQISTEEQRRIGHDLHDGVGQEVTGLGYLAQSLAEALAQDAPPQAALARKIVDGLRRTNEQLRAVSRGLVPVDVEAGGLAVGLANMAERTCRLTEVECSCSSQEPIPQLDHQRATHLYRIAQEAVNNALKHGRPRHIRIGLEVKDKQLVLEIIDDGVGIADNQKQGEGMGLRIMGHRASLIGAMLSVGPGERGGTSVRCALYPERSS